MVFVDQTKPISVVLTGIEFALIRSNASIPELNWSCSIFYVFIHSLVIISIEIFVRKKSILLKRKYYVETNLILRKNLKEDILYI